MMKLKCLTTFSVYSLVEDTMVYILWCTSISPCIYRLSQKGALMAHYGVEEITVNVRKMFKKFY
jgi:hypothetical protein